MTRDGRMVFELREAVINDGETVLVGYVTTKPWRRYKGGDEILTESHIWFFNGSGCNHGGHDLMTLKKCKPHTPFPLTGL